MAHTSKVSDAAINHQLLPSESILSDSGTLATEKQLVSVSINNQTYSVSMFSPGELSQWHVKTTWISVKL